MCIWDDNEWEPDYWVEEKGEWRKLQRHMSLAQPLP